MEKKEKIYLEFLEVSKQTGVPVKKILDMFWYLLRGKVIENNELVRLVGVSRNALNQVKKALSAYLNSSRKETTFLKVDMAEKIGALYASNYLVEEQLLTSLIESSLSRRAIRLLSRYKEIRPAPKRNYDQFTATVETTTRRVALLNFLGDLKGKRVLFLGDDDFTSVVAANMKQSEYIAVVDIDERILDTITSISEELGLGIGKKKHDLRIQMPDELKGKFDIVFTDPPYTPGGIRLFISRALDALDKKNQSARLYICYGNSDRARERFLPIQEIITESGLMIKYAFDRFNRYEGAESIGSSSSLYVLETTPKARSLVKGNYDKPIYTID